MTTTSTTTTPAPAPDNTLSTTTVLSLCHSVKAICSIILLLFSIVLVLGLIFTEQTRVSSSYHPVVALMIVILSLLLLSMVEGSQASLVGLTPVQPSIYKQSHPITYKICTLVYTGDNFHRYLLGRQFLVVLLIYMINICGAPIADVVVELWGFPDFIKGFFLVSGIAMILSTSMIAQLPSQVIASHCMLDYINTHVATIVVYTTLVIEFTGILHASYVCSFIIHYFANRVVETNEPRKTGFTYIFFWFRCLMSCTLLVYSLAVTVKSLCESKTTMWWDDIIPPAVSIIILLVLMSVVGLLEGMQIAYFASAKLCKEDRGTTYIAQKSCHLLFQGDGSNLPSFMIGRQLFVVANFFIIAHITTLDTSTKITTTSTDAASGDPSTNNNIFHVSDFVQSIFNTGLLGTLITTIIGSIAWQLLASAFPVAFLSSPITYGLLRICLWLEASGIMSGSWVLGSIIKCCIGAQRDEVYIGTAEDRVDKNFTDDDTDNNLHLGAGHIVKLPGFNVDHSPKALKDLMIKKNLSVSATCIDSLSVIQEEGYDGDDYDGDDLCFDEQSNV